MPQLSLIMCLAVVSASMNIPLVFDVLFKVRFSNDESAKRNELFLCIQCITNCMYTHFRGSSRNVGLESSRRTIGFAASNPSYRYNQFFPGSKIHRMPSLHILLRYSQQLNQKQSVLQWFLTCDSHKQGFPRPAVISTLKRNQSTS